MDTQPGNADLLHTWLHRGVRPEKNVLCNGFCENGFGQIVIVLSSTLPDS